MIEGDQMSSVSVSIEWEPLGEIRLDGSGRLAFPKAPLRPGLYKFRFVAANQVDVYVGESDQLARRFQHYRTPGPSQRTNLRLREKMTQHLKDGGTVEVQIATDRLTITIGTEARPA